MVSSSNRLLFTLAKAFRGSRVVVVVTGIGVAVSIMVMVIALCVVDGFTYEVESKVKGMVADFNIIKYGSGAVQGEMIERNFDMEQELADRGFKLYPYLNTSGLARRDGLINGVMLKGVGDMDRLNFYKEYLISGRLPRIEGDKRAKEIIISEELSKKMKLKDGSKLEIVFMEEPPFRELYNIVGVYNTAIGTFDKGLIITDMRNVQYIEEASKSEVGGYEIIYKGDNIDGYDKLCDIVDDRYGDLGFMVRSTREDYPQIFSWLGLQKSNELVIIAIMMIVVIINVVSLLLILLLNNIYQIGVLTVVGMTKNRIRAIFMINSLTILTKAMLVGNILTIALLMAQKHFKIIRLDSDGYSVDSVPVYFNWGDIFLLNLGVIVVLLLFQWITTFFIGKVRPTEVLKYEKR